MALPIWVITFIGHRRHDVKHRVYVLSMFILFIDQFIFQLKSNDFRVFSMFFFSIELND